jgi:CysZ protein
VIRDVALALGQLSDPRFQRVLWRGVGLALLLLVGSSAALLWLLTWCSSSSQRS